MRGPDRLKRVPTIEVLETKTLLSATVGALRVIQTDAGARVTVEREQIHFSQGHVSLDLQVRGGGRRFQQSYRLSAPGLSTKAPVPLTELVALFAASAGPRIAGSSGAGFDKQDATRLGVQRVKAGSSGGSSAYSATVTDGGVPVHQSISIRETPVRGVFPSNAFTATDAFNLLLRELATRRPGAARSGTKASTDLNIPSVPVGPLSGFFASYGQGSIGGGLGVGPNPGISGTAPIQAGGSNLGGTGTGTGTGTGVGTGTGTGTTGTGTTGTGTGVTTPIVIPGVGTGAGTGTGVGTVGTGTAGTGTAGTGSAASGSNTNTTGQ